MASDLALITHTPNPLYEAALDEATRYFSAKSTKFAFQKSHTGGSGLTFLPLDCQFGWVVKWQNRKQAEIEYLCTEFYRRSFSHISIPEMILRQPSELQKKLLFYFRKQSISPTHTPMLIGYKNGNTFNKLCENRHLFSLPVDELHKMACYFGEIAGYDFAIGNCDRIIPTGFRGTIDPLHEANGGNIMVELVVPENVDGKTIPSHLSTVHAIDNGPHFLAFFDSHEQKAEGVVEDTIDWKVGSLFGEEDEPESQPVEKKTTEPLKSGIELRKTLQGDFQYFMTATPEQMELLAHQIVIGLENESKRDLPGQVHEIDQFFRNDSNLKAVQTGICEGLLKARRELQNPKLEATIGDLKEEAGDFLQTAHTTLDFIRENLVFAQKTKIKVE